MKRQRRLASSPIDRSSIGEIASPRSTERCLHQSFQMLMQYLVSSCVLLGIALLFALAISSSDLGGAKDHKFLDLVHAPLEVVGTKDWVLLLDMSNLGRLASCINSC